MMVESYLFLYYKIQIAYIAHRAKFLENLNSGLVKKAGKKNSNFPPKGGVEGGSLGNTILETIFCRG